MTQEIHRTPADRFAGLPGYPFEPRWVEDLDGFSGLRMHYLDEGPEGAEETFLCLHGQPTWSYLYRKMIPVFAAAGGRVVAPDLFGFGRSDKPVDDNVYSFDFHRRSLVALVRELDLRRLTLVVHDWGGILGLTLPFEMAERVERLVVMNTFLGTGELPPSKGFLEWKAWAAAHPDLELAPLMRRACPTLEEAEAAAYAAPFPDRASKAGVRRFPELVPLAANDPGAEISRQARDWLTTEWTGKSFFAVGMQDKILGPPAMRILASWIRDAGPMHEVADAGHFVPEHGAEIARRALDSFAEKGT